ncbi:cation-transporting P-type ATPase, partial [Dubosiella newyorkensis]
MQYYHQPIDVVLKELDVSFRDGLTSEQVEKRLQQYGLNKLKEAKKKSNFQRFLDQLKDPMILILLVAA